jgi:hypothetical protein
VHKVDQYFAASLPSQASRYATKPIKGKEDDFQWSKTDTYDVLVINPVLKACHPTTDICTYLCKSTILSKSAVITLILKLSNSYYNKIPIMRLICGTMQSLLSTNSAISDSGSQS